jgi:hypothetical protein
MAHSKTGGRRRADTRPYGPEKPERVVIATTDPATLPDLTTFSPFDQSASTQFEAGRGERTRRGEPGGVVRLYGLRMWVEQSRHPGQVRGFAGRSTRSGAIARCDGIGSWSAAPSPTAGITRRTLPSQNHMRRHERKDLRLWSSRKRSRQRPSPGKKKVPE